VGRQWRLLTEQGVRTVGGYLGVYELREGSGEVIRIGYAGSRSLHGLGGELRERLAHAGPDIWFRFEITSAYLSRHQELLMQYKAVHARLPRDNPERPEQVGRLTVNFGQDARR
jgi:hypothetical protein